MNEKGSFVMYNDWGDDFRDLTNDERGKMITAIFDFQQEGNIVDFKDRFLNNLLRRYVNTFRRDAEKWDEVKEKRSEAGKLGGAPKGNTNAKKQAKTSKNNQNQAKQAKQAKQAVNVNGNVPVNVNENVNVIGNEDVNVESSFLNLKPIFEAEFCRSLKQNEITKLNEWSYDFNDDLVLWALREAVLSGVKDFNYICKILSRCEEDGIATAEEAEAQKAMGGKI